MEAPGEPSTPGLVQHFAGTEHERGIAEVLAITADQALTVEQVEVEVLAAAAKLREDAEQQAVKALLAKPLGSHTPTELEALSRRFKAGQRPRDA